jgi:hypothetical protein
MGPKRRTTLPSWIPVLSSSTIAAEVQAKADPAAKTLSAVASLAPSRLLSLHAGDILRALGKVTTPPSLRMLPFEAAGQWAWTRYFWAFRRSVGGRLLLTPEAQGMRYHHSTVMSEHMGIAFALEVSRQVLKNANPGCSVTFHDIDFVLEGLDLTGTRVRVGAERPDYIARVVHPDGRATYHILECKGRREVNWNEQKEQLARGAKQVQSIRLRRRRWPSLIVSTIAGPSGIQVVAIDPPEDNPAHELPERVEPLRTLVITEMEGVEAFNEEELVNRIETMASAEILLEAGYFLEAADLLSIPRSEISGIRNYSEIVEFEGKEYVGQSQLVPVVGERITFFRGVTNTALNRALNRKSGTEYPVLELPFPEVEPEGEPIFDDEFSDEPALEWELTPPDDSGFVVGAWPTNSRQD